MEGKLLQKIRGEWMECNKDSILTLNSNGDITIRQNISNILQVIYDFF